jgi:hypothetical protein
VSYFTVCWKNATSRDGGTASPAAPHPGGGWYAPDPVEKKQKENPLQFPWRIAICLFFVFKLISD